MAQIFKVGGCIRDKFLGLDSKDIDFTFVCENSQSVEEGWGEMVTWLMEHKFTIFLQTPECFTIRAKFPDGHEFEGLVADFVMARKEVGYIEGTRRPILELGTLHDDLIRRDFTVNAIAEDIDGNLIDPFDGVGDIHAGILKTPIDATQTMMDDPLRILRAIRFTITKGFQMSEEIWLAIQQPGILKKLAETVSQERIKDEVFKMMKFNTVQSFRLLMDIDELVPGFLELIFKEGMWMMPTTKQ